MMLGVDVLADRDLAHVDVQDLLAAADVGQLHVDLAVEAARAQQGGVQDVGPVGGRDHDHAQVGFEAVHLDQHLVQGLLALVVAAAQAGAALAADRVDFIDEDDAGRVLLGVLEHVAHAGRAHADEHFDEIGAGNAEERHLGLAGDALGQQGLAGARRADQQQAARNAAAELLELLRVLQEVDDFLHLFFRFVTSGNIGESDLVVVLVEHARLALAEAEGAALAAALHLAHEVDPDPDQQQHRPPADQQGHQQRAFLARLDVELDAVVDEVADQAAVEVGGGGADLPVIRGDRDDLGAALAFLDDRVLDALAAHFLQEIGIAHHAGTGGTARVELLENGKQHEGDDQPHGYFGKPLIVQLRLRESTAPSCCPF